MTDRWYRVVRIVGQGYGTMTPEAWDATPEGFRERVHVLELVPDQRSATARYRRLVRATGEGEWQDKSGLHKAHGQWWIGRSVTIDGVCLHVLAGAPLPMSEVEIPPELYALADILGRLPPERSRADIRALDWYATQSSTPSRPKWYAGLW